VILHLLRFMVCFSDYFILQIHIIIMIIIIIIIFICRELFKSRLQSALQGSKIVR